MKPRRPHIPLAVKLEAALRQLGLEPHEVELDHDPPLALRDIDPVTGEYNPPANDPKFLMWRSKQDHRAKTTGRRGESRLVDQSDGDVPRIAKLKRLTKAQEEFTAKLLARQEGIKIDRKKGRIPSRAWPKKRREK